MDKLLSTILLLGLVGLATAAEPQNVAKQLSMTDIDGRVLRIGDNSGATVLVFINSDCPIANAYHPELRKLAEDFADKHLNFVMVHANPKLSEEEARQQAKLFDIRWPIVLDPDQSIAKSVDAKVTPEAFVLDARGIAIYRGRIDDRFYDYGKKRANPTRMDLRVAIEEHLAGKTISLPKTDSVGCIIGFPKN